MWKKGMLHGTQLPTGTILIDVSENNGIKEVRK